MSSLVVVVGNPSLQSRTRGVADGLADRVSALTGADRLPTIDLADHAGRAFLGPSETLDRLGEQVASADYVIFATLTYTVSYTGLLQAFLDRYWTKGLESVVAIPVFTIGSPAHTPAVDFTLRPLLVELGASVATAGLAFETVGFENRGEILDRWLEGQSRSIPKR